VADGFATRVTAAIAALAEGDVASYSEIAALAGRPGAPRAVGMLLARSDGLPWWRVVNASGRLVPGHEKEQARLLRREGVAVAGNHVVGFRSASTARRPPPTAR
jgi:methylated-DNA-protein-cysteine methyltransferase-like protein